MAKHQIESDMILNSLLTAILLFDKNLRITYANEAALQLLEQNSKKIYGCTLPELCHYCSLDISLMNTALSSGQGFTDNEVNLVIHQKLFVLSVTAQQFNQEHILIEMRPLNNHKRISQEQLLHDQHLAAKELVRGLAHEIKNPLGGLRGAAQLLSLELPQNELQEYTKLIIEQADRLRNLVDRLLGPQQVLKQEISNIHVPIEKTYSLLQLSTPSNITLVRDYDPSIPDLLHDAEPIEQVILNLANNAIQALGEQEGLITFRTRTVFQTTINGICYRLCARIDIEDNGPGIPINLRDTIFYPLVSGRKDGSGLGLSIAQHIIDQHHGKIEFVSWPGHTTFSIYLPIKQ